MTLDTQKFNIRNFGVLLFKFFASLDFFVVVRVVVTLGKGYIF
jgi:hypothetical protein